MNEYSNAEEQITKQVNQYVEKIGVGKKSKEKGFFDKILDGVQVGLDVVGLIPVVGEIADGVNGSIYLARGDEVNAALSFAAMIPVVGNAATGAKYVNKGLKYGEEIADAGKTIKKDTSVDAKPKVDADIPKSEVTQKSPTNTNDQIKQDSADALITPIIKKKSSKGIDNANRLIPGTPGVITGGNSNKLGKNMLEEMGLKRSTKWSGYQAQHIIPSEMATNPVIQKIGINFDDSTNGVFLRVPDSDISTMSRHRGYHSVYNEVVERALNRMDINQSVDDLQKQVYELQSNLRKLQEKGLPLYPSQGATVELWERKLKR